MTENVFRMSPRFPRTRRVAQALNCLNEADNILRNRVMSPSARMQKITQQQLLSEFATGAALEGKSPFFKISSDPFRSASKPLLNPRKLSDELPSIKHEICVDMKEKDTINTNMVKTLSIGNHL